MNVDASCRLCFSSAQGGRLEAVRRSLGCVTDQHCYRAGDYDRLISRVDQLEQMLGLQTYLVRVPYEYEIPGTELFDTGNVHLRPTLHDYYGLQHVQWTSGVTAQVFLTGRNFHPTNTHVIAGGAEAHSLGTPPAVEVISRQLLRVTIPENLNEKLSRDGGITLRVGTPAGVSNPLDIEVKPPAPPSRPKKPDPDFVWKGKTKFWGDVVPVPNSAGAIQFYFGSPATPHDEVTIAIQKRLLLPEDPGIFVHFTFTMADGKPSDEWFATKPVKTSRKSDKEIEVSLFTLEQEIKGAIERRISQGDRVKEFTGEVYLKFDQWPATKIGQQLKIEVVPPQKPGQAGNGNQPQPSVGWSWPPHSGHQTTQAALPPVQEPAGTAVATDPAGWPR